MIDEAFVISVRLGEQLITARAAQRAHAFFQESDVALEDDEVEETTGVRLRGEGELTASSR